MKSTSLITLLGVTFVSGQGKLWLHLQRNMTDLASATYPNLPVDFLSTIEPLTVSSALMPFHCYVPALAVQWKLHNT
jgi:hypothetical protein